VFLQDEGVDAGGVVPGDDVDDAVLMAFVEGQGGSIVDGGFQHHGMTRGPAQALLGGGQELRTEAAATAFGEHINGDDVTYATAAGFGDDETSKDAGCSGAMFGDDGERSAAPEVGGQLPPGVGDAGRKAPLVDAPQDLKILGPKVSQGKLHLAILSGTASPAAFLCTGKGFRASEKTSEETVAWGAPQDVPCASEMVVGYLILIYVGWVAGLVGLWYFCLAGYNRRRGILALRKVEAACTHRARVVDAHWIGASRLQARLRFATHWFENAQVTIRLLPRPLPVQWLLSRWRKQRETVTFEADLDHAPGVQMEVFRHHWLSDSDREMIRSSRNWTVARSRPVVLTTSNQWRQELPPIVNTLMSSRGHSLLKVRLRPESPHLAATMDLDALTGEEAVAGFLGVLRELASGASRSRQ
jgi:hypothetical protein